MNKGSALLQAEQKLVYYGAPFEISVGGSGRAEHGGFSLHHVCLGPSGQSRFRENSGITSRNNEAELIRY